MSGRILSDLLDILSSEWVGPYTRSSLSNNEPSPSTKRDFFFPSLFYPNTSFISALIPSIANIVQKTSFKASCNTLNTIIFERLYGVS